MCFQESTKTVNAKSKAKDSKAKNGDVGRNDESEPAPAPAKKGKKKIEEIYQKKTQLEHILLRPDTYIGK